MSLEAFECPPCEFGKNTELSIIEMMQVETLIGILFKNTLCTVHTFTFFLCYIHLYTVLFVKDQNLCSPPFNN